MRRLILAMTVLFAACAQSHSVAISSELMRAPWVVTGNVSLQDERGALKVVMERLLHAPLALGLQAGVLDANAAEQYRFDDAISTHYFANWSAANYFQDSQGYECLRSRERCREVLSELNVGELGSGANRLRSPNVLLGPPLKASTGAILVPVLVLTASDFEWLLFICARVSGGNEIEVAGERLLLIGERAM